MKVTVSVEAKRASGTGKMPREHPLCASAVLQEHLGEAAQAAP